MKDKLPFFILSGITSVALLGLFELNAQASTVQQKSSFPTQSVNVDGASLSTTYFSPRQPELNLEAQTETLAEPNSAFRAGISEQAKIVVTPTPQSLAAYLNQSPQLSVAQKPQSNLVETDTASRTSHPDTVERQVPTIAEANLPPIATTQNSADLLQQSQSVQPREQATLAQASPEEQFPPAEEVVPDDPDEIDPGRPTRSGTSYIGVGANFGVGGDTSLGDSGLFLYSKVGLTRYFSIRPAVNTDFEEDATFLLPLTFDLAPIAVGDTGVRVAPYFGGGPAVSTTGDFGPVISGGVDLPLTKRLTVTSGVNIGILDETDVGVFVGVGYTFPNLF